MRTQIVQANVLKSSVIQGIVLFSALVIKPILRRAVGLRAGEGITSSVILFGFHVRATLLPRCRGSWRSEPS